MATYRIQILISTMTTKVEKSSKRNLKVGRGQIAVQNRMVSVGFMEEVDIRAKILR